MNEKHQKITKAERREAAEMVKAFTVVRGQKRVVEKCLDCGRLIGRQFTPHGLSIGQAIDPCLDWLTQRSNFKGVTVLTLETDK
jgi:hypothetical protein